MRNFLAKLKMSFSPFSLINWVQAEKYGPKTPGGMVNESEVIKILSNLDPRDPKGPKETKNS